jgi:predicted ABC-type sugar transport system permease subunit
VPDFCRLDATADDGGRRRERAMAARYEYKVEEIREGMLGGKMSGDKLEKVLNDNAGQGWQLKAITAVEVKGRVGPGGVEGVLVTFERPVA